MEPFEVALQYENRDWVRAYRTINATQPNMRRARLLGPAVCFLAGFALNGGGSDGLSSGITLAISVALINLATPWLQALQTRKAHEAVPGGGVVTVHIDNDGVTTRNGSATNHFGWTAVTGTTETEHGILIEIGKGGTRVVLPSRLLSAEQLAAARHWLDKRQPLATVEQPSAL